MSQNTDGVAIIGGGPAGSALGCYLSKAGIKNTIYEAAVHPRPHVGESMVMSSVQVFEELGFLPVLEREGFVRKYGASWHPPTAKGEAAIAFKEFPSPSVNQDYTYHVNRESSIFCFSSTQRASARKCIRECRSQKSCSMTKSSFEVFVSDSPVRISKSHLAWS